MIRVIAVVVLLHASAAYASHCHELSPVVGYQHCGGFGSRWRAPPPITIEGGVVVERVGLHVLSTSGVAYSPTAMTTYHAAIAPGSSLHATGTGGRMAWGYDGPVSAKLSTTVVLFGHPSVITTDDNGAVLATSRGGDSLDIAATVGVHRRFGDVSYGAEIAAGVRFVWFQVPLPDGFTTCTGGAAGKGCIDAITDIRPLVEPRVDLEYWLHRHVSLKLTAAYSAIGDGESISLGIGFHVSPYDGT